MQVCELACTAADVATDSSKSHDRSKCVMHLGRVVVLCALAHLLLLPGKQPWVLQDDLLDHVRLAAASCCC